jgi:NTE family protein
VRSAHIRPVSTRALSEAGIHPDWIAGISIGAINAAIIAGNPPNSSADRLREFWTQATADGFWPYVGDGNLGFASGDAARNLLNQMSATVALASGASGFSAARPVTPWLQPGGAAMKSRLSIIAAVIVR